MIHLDIINESGSVLNQLSIEQLFSKISKIHKPQAESFLELIAVSRPKIATLNRKYLKRTGATDIISFPNANPKDDPHISLGSLVICPEYIDDQKEELLEVVLHGYLHLIGHDHKASQNDWDQALRDMKNELSKI